MPHKTLIILFGHENDDSGKLTPIAVARCNTALGLLRQYPHARVLPTGSYGEHFNRTERPHSQYLSEFLEQQQIDPARILPGTNSNGTFEDCLCARKIALDQEFTNVVAVTSDYHSSRVAFILGRLFTGIPFTVHAAPTEQEYLARETKKEQKRFGDLKKHWITPPLYTKNQEFPKSVFDECAGEHRHYDTISLAAISAMLVVGAFPFVASFNIQIITGQLRAVTFLAAAVIDALLLLIYLRAADDAKLARRIMQAIEVAYDQRAFSSNYHSKRSWTPPMRLAVVLMAFVMIAASIIGTTIAWGGGFLDCQATLFLLLKVVLIYLGIIAAVVFLGWFSRKVIKD
jgi:uncharacterized SAM-binding protein YcdF (DUF218 family)